MSKVYVSGVKLWNFPTYQWFSQVFLIFLDRGHSEPREHWLCRENFTFGQEKFKVWHLKYRRLRSHKLKFGRENFKVWHLKHRRLTSVENVFSVWAFKGRCNWWYLLLLQSCFCSFLNKYYSFVLIIWLFLKKEISALPWGTKNKY